MREVGTYPFTYHSPSASVRGWTDHPKWDNTAYPHNSQVSERSFQCTLCPEQKYFAQKQGLLRHHRERHQPGFGCSHLDCDYEWTRSRRYEYRKHLKNNHRLEDDKIDEILAMAPRLCHRRGRVIESNLPSNFSPPPIERDRQNLVEPQQRPLVLPLPTVGKDANHASPPLIPSVAYNSRLGHAEPEITTTEHEESSELEHLATTHAPSRLISEEDFALLGGHYKIHGRFRFPSVHPGGPTTADIPPNPGMLHTPTLPSPVGEYHASPVSGGPALSPWTDAASTLTYARSWPGQLGI